jgi:HEAT repeats
VAERNDNEVVLDPRFESNAPLGEQRERRRVNYGVRLAVASSGLVLALAFFLALKPTSARAVWEEFERMMELKGGAGAGAATAVNASRHLHESLASLPPQAQAELLLEESLSDTDGASALLPSHVEGWRGKLTMSPRLTALLDSALNARDLSVRAAAIEMELAVYDLPKTKASADKLIERIEADPAGRTWALWMLGAIGNRGIERERALETLVRYAHDPDEKTRYWAVEGLSLIGSDATVGALLEIFRNDPSLEIRERAGCGLAQSGMLTKEQRFAAVPALMDYGEDPSLDSNTRDWTYKALREITGARYGTNPTDWREWWAENARR